jgi:hypothetical protein
VNRLGDKAVGEEAVQEAAVSQAQEEACLAAPGQAVFAGQGRLNPGLEKTRVFKKKTSPVGFFGFSCFYLYNCPEERVFGVFQFQESF